MLKKPKSIGFPQTQTLFVLFCTVETTPIEGHSQIHLLNEPIAKANLHIDENPKDLLFNKPGVQVPFIKN